MAITEVYVNNAGSGGQTGIDAANAISWASMITAINGGSAAGNRYNVTGAIARTTNADTISGSGTATSPVIIRGYNSSIGDLAAATRTNNNGLLVTTNFPALSYTGTTAKLTVSGSYIVLETMNITSAASSPTLSGSSATFVIKSCKITNSSTNASATAVSPNVSPVIDCDVALTGGSGGTAALDIGNSTFRIIGCRCTSNSSTAPGVRLNAANGTMEECVVYACAGFGVLISSTASSVFLNGLTVVGCLSDGIKFPASTTGLPSIKNCLITDNSGFGINFTATTCAAFLAWNRYRDNNGGGSNLGNAGDWITATNYGAVTSGNGTSDYTNAGSGDYSLLSTSPAVNAGQPYSRSIGALQRGQSGGGGISAARVFTGMGW